MWYVCQDWRDNPREYGYIINLLLFTALGNSRVRPTGRRTFVAQGLLFLPVFFSQSYSLLIVMSCLVPHMRLVTVVLPFVDDWS